MELCIDTSTRYASIGCSEKGELLQELTWRSQRNHSVELAPAVETLLKRQKITVKDLEAVFVAKGPGAFSALRVGMSLAKSLSVGAEIPIVGIPTSDVEVEPYINISQNIIALVPAGRERAYVARYVDGDVNEEDIVVRSYDEMNFDEIEDPFFCGEGLKSVLESEYAHIINGKHASDVPPTRKTSVLVKLGYGKLESGKIDDPMSLEPIYVRSAQIESADRSIKK
ncbi:MAG: tRNA (adenosine(37)-N6)-threonylcarbamoyltransferase complex dimerization subunit type 1 TsaB [Chloroflexota bacterium]|nr:tRNA (adenosine(37)-N6)-threonylcarbamoyltransferase complex dimerization subunit type 1 TsaB [Chloroflexota bacterium]